MLIHHCMECGTLSINRIAADDHPASVMEVFHQSRALSRQLRAEIESQGILLLAEAENVTMQLYGEPAMLEWS